jgi:hypothetical protein
MNARARMLALAHQRAVATFAAAVAASVLCAFAAVSAASTSGNAQAASVHFACSAQDSAKVPCHFSTPSGNIRCLWTPEPDNVACVLRNSGRAYRLRPAGRAQVIRLRLARRGETLPRTQQIVFPKSLSCRDTNTTMTCNQDFGRGAFSLAQKGSHSS